MGEKPTQFPQKYNINHLSDICGKGRLRSLKKNKQIIGNHHNTHHWPGGNF